MGFDTHEFIAVSSFIHLFSDHFLNIEQFTRHETNTKCSCLVQYYMLVLEVDKKEVYVLIKHVQIMIDCAGNENSQEMEYN